MVFRIKRWISNSYLTRRSNYGYRCESDMVLYQWRGICNYVHYPFKCYLKGTVNQGNKTRKGNGCCVVSAYILKPVLNQFVNKNFENFDNSHNSFLWQEYLIDFFYVKEGSHVRLWHPSCVYFTSQRQYTAVLKMWNSLYIIILCCQWAF